MYLEQNLKGLCQKFGIDYLSFLEDFQVESCTEIPLLELEAIAEEYEIDLQGLIFKPMFKNEFLSEKIARIKLLILDVDGVMTDGGMYFCESGDQFKKFNTKDGMGIIEIQKSNQLQAAIISSAFKGEAVKQRAALLGIERCYVGRDKKLAVLETWMEEMGISIDEVAIIGDDVNDLPIISQCGFSACPSDAVATVKQKVDVVLTSKGGEGCVRELIDNFLLNTPLGSEF